MPLVAIANDRQLYVERAGHGHPTVVFEAGMGASRNSWGAVAPLVAARTSTVVYDRAGLGRSPADGARRDLARLSDDLGSLLSTLGSGPFVLVGHSWGGPIIRCAAAASPGRICGLVLVDVSDERADLFFSANQRQTRWTKRLAPLLARLGAFRLLTRRLSRTLPEPSASLLRAEDGTPAAVATQVAELEHHVDDLRRLRDDPPVWPEVPVVVISGERPRPSRIERGYRPGLVAAHRETAAAVAHGRHVAARRSTHYVPFTEPELIANEIFTLLDTLQR